MERRTGAPQCAPGKTGECQEERRKQKEEGRELDRISFLVAELARVQTFSVAELARVQRWCDASLNSGEFSYQTREKPVSRKKSKKETRSMNPAPVPAISADEEIPFMNVDRTDFAAMSRALQIRH